MRASSCPMCDTCSRGYFMDWANNRCEHCDEVGQTGPIIAPIVIVGVVMLLAAAYAMCRWFAPPVLRPVLQYVNERFQRVKAVYQASQNKLDIIIYGAMIAGRARAKGVS